MGSRRAGLHSGVYHARGYKSGANSDEVQSSHIWIPANELSLQTSGTAATAGQVDDSFALLFSDTSDNDANYTLLVPDWVQGNNLRVEAKLYWSSGDTNGNDATWDIEYGSFAEGEDIDMSSPTNVTVTDTDDSTANVLNVTDALTMTGISAGDILVMRLFRDVSDSDDLAADVALRGVKLTIKEA